MEPLRGKDLIKIRCSIVMEPLRGKDLIKIRCSIVMEPLRGKFWLTTEWLHQKPGLRLKA